MINIQPIVKHKANFCGIRTMTGRNMLIAMKIKNTPTASNRPKYIRAFPVGTLVVAVWRFPGKSLTLFDTLYSERKK